MTNENIKFYVSCWFVIVLTLNLVPQLFSYVLIRQMSLMLTLSPSPYSVISTLFGPLVKFCVILTTSEYFITNCVFFSTGNRNKIIVSVYKSFTTAKHMEVHVAEVISFIGNPVYRKSTQKLNYYIIEWFKIVLSPVKYIMAWYKREWRS